MSCLFFAGFSGEVFSASFVGLVRAKGSLYPMNTLTTSHTCILLSHTHPQRMSTTQRYLVHKCTVMEVMELNVRPGFRNKHRRCIFFFNDIAVVCKKKNHELYIFKETFSLMNLLSVKFETSCKINTH